MGRVPIALTTWGTYQDRLGNALAGTSVTVKNLDGSPATHWSAVTGGSSATTALAADVNGQLPRYIEGGDYLIDVPALSITGQRVPAVSGGVENSTVGVLNAAGFSGVDRTGVANSATGLQTAFTAASARGIILPYGTYKSLSGLTVPAAGMTLTLDDAILDFSGIAAAGAGITASGTVGTPVAVNAVAFGATTVTGVAGIEAGLVAGDRVKIVSADVYDPGRTASTVGEIFTVASTASGVITARSPIMGSYSTTVRIAKVTPTFLTVKGTGQILMGGSGSSHKAILARQAMGLRIDGSMIQIRNAEATGIQLFDCVDFEISHVDVEGSSAAATGYGVSIANCSQFGRVHHSHFRNCRHATSVNTSTSDLGGIPRHIGFDHCEVRDTIATGDAMDCHAAAEYVDFDNNVIYDSGNVGINIECPKASVTNNKIYRTADIGIYLLNCATGPAEYRCEDNEIYDAQSYGIRYGAVTGSGATSPTVLDVRDNLIVRATNIGVYIDPTSGAVHRLTGARVTGNRVHSATAGLAGIYVLAADASEVCDNSVMNHANGVIGCRVNDFTRGKFTGNLTSFASAGTVRAHYGVGVTDSNVSGNIARNATGVGGKGLELDGTSANCTVSGNGLRGATTPLTLNSVTSHITTTADAAGAYNKVA